MKGGFSISLCIGQIRKVGSFQVGNHGVAPLNLKEYFDHRIHSKPSAYNARDDVLLRAEPEFADENRPLGYFHISTQRFDPPMH